MADRKSGKSATNGGRERMVQRIDEIEWYTLYDIPRRFRFPFRVHVVGWVLAGAAHYRGAHLSYGTEFCVRLRSADATAVAITVPKDAESVKVEIPVEDVKPGTVAIIVHEDGTEEIVKTSTTSGNGVVLALESGASVKVVDNTRTFNDVSGSEWYADNVTWAASREVMNGVSPRYFAPSARPSRRWMCRRSTTPI